MLDTLWRALGFDRFPHDVMQETIMRVLLNLEDGTLVGPIQGKSQLFNIEDALDFS